MDAIIDRLAAIEQSAARLIDSAASEKKGWRNSFMRRLPGMMPR